MVFNFNWLFIFFDLAYQYFNVKIYLGLTMKADIYSFRILNEASICSTTIIRDL